MKVSEMSRPILMGAATLAPKKGTMATIGAIRMSPRKTREYSDWSKLN